MKVFISYRHVSPDAELALELESFLVAAGFEVFIDRRLLTGQEWVAEIERQLRGSQYFIALLSVESIRSDMVRWEIELAHSLKAIGKLRILPVRVGYEGQLPMDLGAYLNRIHYSFWRPGTPMDSVCGDILTGIQAPSAEEIASETEPSAEGLRLLAQATNWKGAPLPSADPRLETGAVKLDSPFYVRRSADQRLEDLVAQQGVTVLITGPRQVGKTSLLARGIAHARARSLATVYIDFQLIEKSRFTNLETLLRYLGAKIAKDLRTKVKPDSVWNEMLGAPDSLTDFLEQAVLDGAEGPVVFALDEVDSVFKCDFRNGFFAMIRAWHDRRSIQPAWERLNLLMVHSTEPALFIDDTSQSPFNVGETIRLSDFTIEETGILNERHGQPLRSAAELAELAALLGGQPYLTRQAFYCLRTTTPSLSDLTRLATDDEGPFGDHLRRLLWTLKRVERTGIAVKQILLNRRCDNESEFQRLKSAGIVSGDSHSAARLRSELYRRYFTKHL